MIDETGIYTRIVRAMAEAEQPSYLFLGLTEFEHLKGLIKNYGLAVTVEPYEPEKEETQRLVFNGARVYRVDCQSFIIAI